MSYAVETLERAPRTEQRRAPRSRKRKMKRTARVNDLTTLWKKYRRHGDEAAREELILRSLPLANYVVGRLLMTLPGHLDREDLLSSAVHGLIEAVDKFDARRKVKFETFAIPRIRGAVLDELRARDWVPRSVRKKESELRRAFASLTPKNQSSAPSVLDLAHAMGLTADELEEVLAQVGSVSWVSLYESYGENTNGEATSVLDFLEDKKSPSPTTPLEFEEKKQALAQAIEELPEAERLIITLYYYENLMLKEIGEILKVSQSRVSQIHTRAVLMLKLKMKRSA